MFSRLNLLIRHLSRPVPNYALTSAAGHASSLASPLTASKMTSAVSPLEKSKRTIGTAACLIIGDEVLGGKVCNPLSPYPPRVPPKSGVSPETLKVRD